MDSLITAAARDLSSGNALGALNHIALRADPPALALRGIAMAQLGDLVRASDLLQRAARAFGPNEAVARARCVVAQAEIALVTRDLSWSAKTLEAAARTLEMHGDRVNVAHARHLQARRLLLIGRIDEAERALSQLDPSLLPSAWRAAHELVVAGISIRRLRIRAARAALARAEFSAGEARIGLLIQEVEVAARALDVPAARLISRREEHPILLEQVEVLLASQVLVVDACRYLVRGAAATISLARRPVLFALARALAEAWPEDASRATLLSRAFRAKHTDETHRARLRVEIGRLRKSLRGLADISSTSNGFIMVPLGSREVVILARPVEEEHGAVLALLADGESWSSSALALALGTSQRSVQRALEALAAEDKVMSTGRARARRWMTPPPVGFTTALLLPASLPTG